MSAQPPRSCGPPRGRLIEPSTRVSPDTHHKFWQMRADVNSAFTLAGSQRQKSKKKNGSTQFLLAPVFHLHHGTPTQFCTCLWSRAGRWAFGQEAGQPPDVSERRGIVFRGALCTEHRTSTSSRNRPVNPVLRGGRDLKQRRSGSFRSQPVSIAGGLSRLVHLAGRAERSPVPIEGTSTSGAGRNRPAVGIRKVLPPQQDFRRCRRPCVHALRNGRYRNERSYSQLSGCQSFR